MKIYAVRHKKTKRFVKQTTSDRTWSYFRLNRIISGKDDQNETIEEYTSKTSGYLYFTEKGAENARDYLGKVKDEFEVVEFIENKQKKEENKEKQGDKSEKYQQFVELIF
jgi:hypothetical protein